MKILRYISYVLMPCLIMSAVLFTSCEEDGNGNEIKSPDGAPEVTYIRLADPDTSDSLIVSAELGTGIVLVGKNLSGTREIFFNDKSASILPTWVTDRTIFVDVPSNAPSKITNILYLVNDKKDTLKVPFKVAIPEPELHSVVNEWPQAKENLIIKGDYFFAPVTITYTGGVVGEIVSITQTQIEVTVPVGAIEGPITLKTNFGETISTFHIWDKRNVILNFDDKNPNGWRIGLRESADGPLDGKYLVVRGNIADNQRDEGPDAPAESPLAMEYWGGRDATRSDNFYPYYPGSYQEYVVKFEAKVKKWMGGHLNLCLSKPDHDGNNQEIWSNTYNPRAIWAPWTKDNKEFSTGDKWITVVIPMSEFQYYIEAPASGIVYTGGKKLDEKAVGSFSTWMIGSNESDGKAVEFYIDNVRFVKP